MSAQPDAAGVLAEQLLTELHDQGLDITAVEDLRRLSGGASRETWSLTTVDRAGASIPRILQRARPGTVAALTMPAEADLLRAAATSGVPVPRVIASGDPSGAMGVGWVLVERVEGETIARRILRDEEYEGGRRALVGQAAAALAAIHRIPSTATTLAASDPLGQMRQLLEALAEPHPALELGVRWLDAHRPEPTATTVVHGDFRLGNLVVGPDGLRAVLDWELAHVGDPMEDLGWLCVRAWRFGEPAPVAGVGERHELFTAYAAAGGMAVDESTARWWEALGCLRWGAICILQADVHLSGASRSVELAAIGRRTCEAEYDLLLLLREAWDHVDSGADASLPSSAERATAPRPIPPHDRPTTGELLDAVREYLEGDVLGATEGRVRFHGRVAANVVAMVAREVTLGPGQATDHTARLAALGFGDDAALVDALRSGALDDRLREVGESVWASVLDKVAVANPSYLQAAHRR